MYRATTPTHIFKLPFAYNDYVSKCLITYSQNGNIVFEKTENDIEANGETITLKLTQEETKLFDEEKIVSVQVRVLTKNNTALASKIQLIPVSNVLNDEVL